MKQSTGKIVYATDQQTRKISLQNFIIEKNSEETDGLSDSNQKIFEFIEIKEQDSEKEFENQRDQNCKLKNVVKKLLDLLDTSYKNYELEKLFQDDQTTFENIKNRIRKNQILQQPSNNKNTIIFQYKFQENGSEDEEYYTIENLKTAFFEKDQVLTQQVKADIISKENLGSLFCWAYLQYQRLEKKLQAELQINNRINILNNKKQNDEKDNIINNFKEQITTLQKELEQNKQLLNKKFLNCQKQNDEKDKIIKNCNEQIATLQQNLEQNKEFLNKQFTRNHEIQDLNNQLNNQLKQNQNQLHQIVFSQQQQILKNESSRIKEVEKYKEEIKLLNRLRDETLKNMKQIIQNDELYSSKKEENQVFQLDEIEDYNCQQILNCINQFIVTLKKMVSKQEILKQMINQDFDLNKDQNQNKNEKIQKLLQQLDKNHDIFIGVINLFEKIIQYFKQFQTINQQLNINNKQLLEKLNEYKQKNYESSQLIKQLLSQLESQKLQEQQKIITVKRENYQNKLEGQNLQGQQKLYIDDREPQIELNISPNLEFKKNRQQIEDSDTQGMINLDAQNKFTELISDKKDHIWKDVQKILELIKQDCIVQGNQRLIQEIKSFMVYFSNLDLVSDIDNIIQKWERSRQLFNSILQLSDKDMNKYKSHSKSLIDERMYEVLVRLRFIKINYLGK